MSRRMFNNSLFTAMETGSLIVLAVVATPILIDSLGLARYGAFVFLNIFSIYGALYFFDLGMEGSLMTYVAKYEAAGEKRKIQGSLIVAILYYGVIGLAVALSLHLASGFIAHRFVDFSGDLREAALLASLQLVAINVLLQFLTLPFVAVLQGMRRYVITKSMNTVANIVQYSLVIVVAYRYGTMESVFQVMVAVSVMRLVAYLFICRYRLEALRDMSYAVRWPLLRILFDYTSILFLCRVMGLINKNVDKFLIWWFLPVTSMGVYDVIARPCNAIRVPESIVGISVIPEVARLNQLGRTDEIKQLYVRLVRYTYLLQMPVAAMVYIFAGDILTVWVGESLAEHANLLLILLTAYLVVPPWALAFQVIVGLEKLRKAVWISLIGTGLNAALSYVLIGQWGITGLLIATLAAQLFMLGPYLVRLSDWLDMRVWEVARPVLVLIGLALGVGLIHFGVRAMLADSVMIRLVTAAVIIVGHYVVEYIFLLDKEEKSYLRSGLHRADQTVKSSQSG